MTFAGRLVQSGARVAPGLSEKDCEIRKENEQATKD
jgi:hypothetical protein